MHFRSAFKCVLLCVFLDSGTVRLRRVRENLAEEWDENNDIFSSTSRENFIAKRSSGSSLFSEVLFAKEGSRQNELQSKCSYQYPFSMASAAHGSANNPCTNIPINCNECENTVIWSCSLNLRYLPYYYR